MNYHQDCCRGAKRNWSTVCLLFIWEQLRGIPSTLMPPSIHLFTSNLASLLIYSLTRRKTTIICNWRRLLGIGRSLGRHDIAGSSVVSAQCLDGHYSFVLPLIVGWKLFSETINTYCNHQAFRSAHYRVLKGESTTL